MAEEISLKLPADQATYTVTTLLSYQTLLLAPYLDEAIRANADKSVTALDPTVRHLLPRFVKAERLGADAKDLFRTIAQQAGRDDLGARTADNDLDTLRRVDNAAPLRTRLDDLVSAPVTISGIKLITQPEFVDPGSGTDTGGNTGLGTSNDSGTSNGPFVSYGDTPGDGDTGAYFVDFSVDQQTVASQTMQQQGGGALNSAFQQGLQEVGALPGGGQSGDADWTNLNNQLAGIFAGVALSIGGPIGACISALAIVLIPRMLAAIEDGIADFITGDIPGW